ncbi:MAG: enolase C-terminal domain-like protein [Pseudolabrys sp.]|nr:enolase C-terminal domain-like protein [Pseudolabrys sp.]MDP2297465.1 enolase C-terminal domain-like protein [Pseudolabrys sp.]
MPLLTVRAIKATPVEVPLNFVLGTSQQALRQVPLLLIDLETEEGITGRSYLFCYLRAAQPAIASLLGEIESLTKGERADPVLLAARLAKRFTLIGVQGIVRMALAGFDVACWDAVAIAADQPLVTLLGAEIRPIPAYNSCGLGIKDDLGELAAEAETLLAMDGFKAVKLRLGYPTLQGDIAAVQAVRRRIGDDVALMVDYNQALSRDEALARGRALDAEKIYWLEEPIRHDDYTGAAALARALKTPVQIGENFSMPANMEVAIDAGAADYVMPDLERIGGVTGWRQAADIAAARKLKMSSHLFPEVSAHLLAATPTCHFLEYVDWASVLLQEPLIVSDGHAIIPRRPGNGMMWNSEAVERYRVR